MKKNTMLRSMKQFAAIKAPDIWEKLQDAPIVTQTESLRPRRRIPAFVALSACLALVILGVAALTNGLQASQQPTAAPTIIAERTESATQAATSQTPTAAPTTQKEAPPMGPGAPALPLGIFFADSIYNLASSDNGQPVVVGYVDDYPESFHRLYGAEFTGTLFNNTEKEVGLATYRPEYPIGISAYTPNGTPAYSIIGLNPAKSIAVEYMGTFLRHDYLCHGKYRFQSRDYYVLPSATEEPGKLLGSIGDIKVYRAADYDPAEAICLDIPQMNTEQGMAIAMTRPK